MAHILQIVLATYQGIHFHNAQAQNINARKELAHVGLESCVPAPPVFAASFCDVVVASNASIDRAGTVNPSPIAV